MVKWFLFLQAGSLTNLAKAPASTVQILGAEKALFRALKTKGNTPKYGLIYHSTFIGRADAKNKGRISRYLANKCSIATRIDSFADEPNRLYGEKLRDQVEERLKFYETGASPRRNIDVMEEVSKELKAAAGIRATPPTPKGSQPMDIDDDEDDNNEDNDMTKSEKKKKKKEKKRKSVEKDDNDNTETKKDSKKLKRMSIDDEQTTQEPQNEDKESAKKSAKKEKKEKKEKKKKKSM
jgi:nucleolar protein 56